MPGKGLKDGMVLTFGEDHVRAETHTVGKVFII
jgi:hypothetical protein